MATFEELSNKFCEDPSYKDKAIQDLEWPDTTDKGKPLNTYGNLGYLLKTLGAEVRWNCMGWTREVVIPGQRIFRDDKENSALRIVTNLAVLNGMPAYKIDDHLTSLAQLNHYHPIVECLKKNPWDGIKRLDDFLNAVQTANNNLSHRLIRRWMLSAVKAIHSEDGIAPQGVLVLQGKQYTGKTTWFKNLDPVGCGAVLEGAILDPTNKDNVFTLGTHWINELGELDATFRRVDMARQKAYITSQFDILRLAYARKNSRIPRRSICGASVNEERFLLDNTGNRRWWVVPVISINNEHGLDMKQVWAEVFEIFKTDENHHLSKEEQDLLEESNRNFEAIDPIEEKILHYFDWSEHGYKFGGTKMSATRVLEIIHWSRMNREDAMRAAKILEKLTGRKSTKSWGKKVYSLPRLLTAPELNLI